MNYLSLGLNVIAINNFVLIEAERILKWMRDNRQENEMEKQNNSNN